MKKEEMKRALGEVEGYIAAIQELLGSNAAAKITESTFKGAINDTAKMMGAQDEQEAAYYWMGDNYADMAAIVNAAYIMAKDAYNKIQPLYFVADKIIPDDPQQHGKEGGNTMASIRPRTNKQGDIISYEIRVTRGRNAEGKQLKPYVMSWPRPAGWSDKAVQREVAKVAGQFEADCNAGLILTKEERLKQEREAQREQERLQQEEERKVTFQRYMEVFMQDKGATYSPNTRENYTVVLNRACSTLGDMRMTDIDFLTVKRYVSDLQTEGKNQFNEKPLAYRTVIKHYIVLHAFFANAVENKVIPSNPMQDMKRPKPRKDEIQKPAVSYTAEEVKRLISCLETEPLKWWALTLFMLDSGCRRGEAVGLKWDSIDFKTGKVEISRNAQYTSGKGTYITTPKSGKSRTIYINAPILAVMREWRREQALQFMAQGIPLNGFCFTQDNGQMMNPQAPTAYLERFGKKYGFPDIHPHALRHTMASLSIANGADIVSISKKLGHAEVSITLDVYSHENEEAKRRASSILNEIIYQKQA